MRLFRLVPILALFAGMLALLSTATALPIKAPAPVCCGGPSELEAGQAPVYKRGRKAPDPAVLARKYAENYIVHGHRLKALPTASPPTFDCRQMGWVGGIDDQGQCGSCWCVSTVGVIRNAYIKAGRAKAGDGWHLSSQYVLDCVPSGACNGDWGQTVIDAATAKGLPAAAAYPAYTANKQKCRYTNQPLFKVATSGFCTTSPARGPASTQDIKNAIAAYGPIVTAVVADSTWDAYRGGVIRFEVSSPGAVDHEVSIIGWDDTKPVAGRSPGAWLVLNQWSDGWGEKGCCWIAYGSHQIGTEATWVQVEAGPPPPPPPPVPSVFPMYIGPDRDTLMTTYDAAGKVTGNAWIKKNSLQMFPYIPPKDFTDADIIRAAVEQHERTGGAEAVGAINIGKLLQILAVIAADRAAGKSFLEIVADVAAILSAKEPSPTATPKTLAPSPRSMECGECLYISEVLAKPIRAIAGAFALAN